MNAENLYVKKFKGLGEWEYKDSSVFFCGNCRKVYSSHTAATDCCQNYTCKCGKICEQKYYLSCDSCTREHDKQREKEKFNKAEKLDIKDYKGYLLSDEYASDDFSMYFDNYFQDECDFSCLKCGSETEAKNAGDIYSLLKCKDCGWESPKYEIIDDIYYLFAPEYIWAADFKPFEMDMDSILQSYLENHHESVDDYLKGKKELKIAIDNFNELNKDVGSYYVSNDLALINIKDYVKKLYE